MLDMDLGSGECGGYAVVALRGELDLIDAADVADALETFAAREPRIIVDLAGLEFIDASGIAALVHGRRHARDAAVSCGVRDRGAGPAREQAMGWTRTWRRVWSFGSFATS